MEKEISYNFSGNGFDFPLKLASYGWMAMIDCFLIYTHILAPISMEGNTSLNKNYLHIFMLPKNVEDGH